MSDKRFDCSVPYDGLSRNVYRRNAEFLVDWICDKGGPGHRIACRMDDFKLIAIHRGVSVLNEFFHVVSTGEFYANDIDDHAVVGKQCQRRIGVRGISRFKQALKHRQRTRWLRLRCTEAWRHRDCKSRGECNS